jgi:coatomer subunit beta
LIFDSHTIELNPILPQPKLLRILHDLADPTTNSITSTAVSFDVASTLVSLTGNPTAVTNAVQKYVSLLTESSDNNVKLIVLGKLMEVRKYHSEVVQNFLMDAFRGISAPSHDVRKKVMDLCLPLVNSKNAKEIVLLLKKELVKTALSDDQKNKTAISGTSNRSSQTSANESSGSALAKPAWMANLGSKVQDQQLMQYRQMLIKALQVTTVHSVKDAETIIFLLIEFLTETEFHPTVTDVIMFVRQLVCHHPSLRVQLLLRLGNSLGDIHHSRVIRG